MRKYPIVSSNGEIYNVNHIGANHTAVGSTIGGNASSYGKAFDSLDEVCLESGMGDIRHCVIGDIKEAYIILREEIRAKQPRSILDYALCVQNTILKYFGDYSSVKKRLSFFPSDEDIEYDGKEMGKVSDLAHKNAAMCVERAMLAQNLLIEIGIKSIYKISGVIVNGKPDAHAYNLVSHDGKYYIFDATIPTINMDKISPIICEISKEVFDKLSKPNCDIGVSVSIEHFNPLQNKDYSITYDAGRDESYVPEKPITK